MTTKAADFTSLMIMKSSYGKDDGIHKFMEKITLDIKDIQGNPMKIEEISFHPKIVAIVGNNVAKLKFAGFVISYRGGRECNSGTLITFRQADICTKRFGRY